MKNSRLSDHELVACYLQGDESSLEVLVSRHKRKIFTTIYLIVKDRYLAEDLFQEAFIKIIHVLRGGRYNEEGKFLPWAIRIARNLAIDYFRKAKRNVKVVTQDGSDVFDFITVPEESREEVIIRQQVEKDIRELIRHLPEEQREVVILRQYGELSFKEIADMTGVSINTALGRMRYALINLRKMIKENSITLQ